MFAAPATVGTVRHKLWFLGNSDVPKDCLISFPVKEVFSYDWKNSHCFSLNFLLCPLYEYILRIHNYNFTIFTRACLDVYFLHLFFDFQIHRLSMACTLLLTMVGVIVIFYFRHWGFKVCECFNMLWFFFLMTYSVIFHRLDMKFVLCHAVIQTNY